MPNMHCIRYEVTRQCLSERLISKENANPIDTLYYYDVKPSDKVCVPCFIDDIVYKHLKNFCSRPTEEEYKAILDVIVSGYKRADACDASFVKNALEKVLKSKGVIMNLDLGVVLESGDYAFICDHSKVSLSARKRIMQ